MAVLHFSVSDTGIGIPADKQHLIFDLFTQADASTTRRYGGTGPGLAISKRLVALMQGRIWVESDANSSSTFHFTARFGVPGARLDSQAPSLRILLGDDNPTNRLLAQHLLEEHGHRVDVALNRSTRGTRRHALRPSAFGRTDGRPRNHGDHPPARKRTGPGSYADPGNDRSRGIGDGATGGGRYGGLRR